MSQGQKDKKWDIRSLSFAPLRTEDRKQHKRPGQKCSSAGCHLLQGQVIHVELMALTRYIGVELKLLQMRLIQAYQPLFIDFVVSSI